MKKLDRKQCWKYCLNLYRDYGYDPYLLYAVVETESNRIIDIQSHSGAYGLMQITEIALREVNQKYKTNYTLEDLKVPEKNIEIGAKYLYRWIDYFEIEYSNFAAVFLAILVYNWGYGNVQYWLTAGDEDNQKITELLPFEKIQYNEDVVWWYVWAKKYFGGDYL